MITQKQKFIKLFQILEIRIYIDATAKNYLSQRLQQHKNDFKKFKEGKMKFQMVFELFDRYGVENCKIILIESFPCMSKDEKTARMEHHKKAAGNSEVGYVMTEEEAFKEFGN